LYHGLIIHELLPVVKMILTFLVTSGNIISEGTHHLNHHKLSEEEIMTTVSKAPVQLFTLEEGRRYAAISQSQPGVAYEVIVHSEEPGDITCNCPGATYRGICKHIRAVERQLAATQTAARQELMMQVQALYRQRRIAMDVISIKAGIKYSKDTGNGWKTIELGAEATIDVEEDWVLAQEGLYSMLTRQLRTLWGWTQNGDSPEPAQNGSEKTAETIWQDLEQALPRRGDTDAPRSLVREA
jgi:hypothetical protein